MSATQGKWPMVMLGEVLAQTGTQISPDPSIEYSEITVRISGKGIVERRRVSGSEINGRRFVARSGNFILSRIDARHGAMGLVPGSLDGALVTNDFPLFRANSERLDLPYLGWLCRTPDFVDLCARASEGTTNRVRLKEERFLALEIPLPPLPKQRRIVARIEALAAEIDEAKRLRREAVEEAGALEKSSMVGLLPRTALRKKLGDLVAPETKISYGVLVPGPDVEDGVPFVRIQDLSIRNASPTPNKHIAPEVDAQYQRTRLSGGEILIGVVGSIGKVGIAPPSWSGANIARAVCRLVAGTEIDRHYLAAVLSAQPCQDYFAEATRTLAQPTLNVGQLSQTPIPLPPLPEQRRIVAELDALQAEVDALKRLQSETAAELDALLPAILDRAFKGEL